MTYEEFKDLPYVERIDVLDRIKPEPKYRPFKDIKEFLPYVDKWVRLKSEYSIFRITGFSIKDLAACVCSDSKWRTLSYLFEYYEFYDPITKEATPCGVLEE